MAFVYPADYGDWTSNGFGMVTPAMKPLNLELVHTPPPAKPNENVDLYGTDGRLPRQQWDDEAVHVIAFQLLGDVDHTGTPTVGTTKAGIFANYAEVCDALARSTWGGATCTQLFTRPDGVDLTGPGQVEIGSLGREGGPIARFTVTLTLTEALTVVP